MSVPQGDRRALGARALVAARARHVAESRARADAAERDLWQALHAAHTAGVSYRELEDLAKSAGAGYSRGEIHRRLSGLGR